MGAAFVSPQPFELRGRGLDAARPVLRPGKRRCRQEDDSRGGSSQKERPADPPAPPHEIRNGASLSLVDFSSFVSRNRTCSE